MQPIGGHLNRSYGENHSVNSPLQRKRKTSDSFSMLCKGHKLTNLKEVGQCFSYADIEDDKAVASSEDDAPLPSSEEYSPVKIGNKNAVKKFYEDIFSRIGQANLKSILKTWIKVIEPRKQSTYPYNGGSKAEASKMMFGEDNPGELTKPPWWPSSMGREGGSKCRHREPDHLTKKGEYLPQILFHLL